LIVPTRRASIEILILAVLIAVFAWRSFVPAWRTLNTDFPSYYVAASLFTRGDSLSRVYDWMWFQRQKDHAGIENRVVPFSPLTLYSALPIVPLTLFQPLAAKRCWLIINLFFLGVSVFALHRITNLSAVRIGILMFLAIEPLQTHFLYGQLHILVLVLLVLSLWLYLKDRSFAAGAMIAVASAIKIYPIVFIAYFIRKRQWRVVAGIAIGVVLLAILAICLFGVQVNRTYLEEVLPRVIRGEVIDPYNLRWNSFTAVTRRLFVLEPELNPQPVMNSPAGFAILLAFIQALLFVPLVWLISSSRRQGERERLEYGTFLAAVLLLSATPASYHNVVLIITGVVAVDFLVRGRRVREAIFVVLAYALAGLPVQRWMPSAAATVPLLGLSRLMFTFGLFLILLWVLARHTEAWGGRLQSRSALVVIPIFLVIVCVGAFANAGHVKSEMNYDRLLRTGTLLATDAVVTKERIAFTTFQGSTYNVGILAGNRLSFVAAGADLFHPSFIPGSSEAFVELAGPPSRIIRVDLNDEQRDFEGPFQVEVENGEQPVVSPDGRWLMFVREVRGRGSLWMKDLNAHNILESAGAIEREVVTADYDVLEAGFAGDAAGIIFAAQPRGEPALFRVGRESSAIAQISSGSGSRYPAESPDGLQIAYSRLRHGNWQIWVKRQDSAVERQLTEGECNSISPAWTPDSKELIYATDCGRGVGLTALARMPVNY